MKPLRARNNRIPGSLVALGLSLLLSSTTLTLAQRPFAQRPNARRPGPGQALPPRLRPGGRPAVNKFLREQQARRKRIDRAAVALLKSMMAPSAAYSGEQITEVAERGMQTSKLRVWGLRGRVRRDYITPSELEGDVMITAPEQYRYFHKRRNILDIALWPTPGNVRDQRMMNLIRQGALSVEKVGEETIAGRNAAIVQVSADGGPNGPGRQMKFWIDPETGIQLKNEISVGGSFVSRSYMTSIQVGPAANVTPQLFEPGFVHNARINPLFPPTSQFASLEEAKDRLPFTPLQPSSLPSGFKLSGVWVFGPEQGGRPALQGTVLLRYSDGVSSFSLFQRRAINPDRPLAGRPGGPLRRSIQHWRVTAHDNTIMDVVYIGSLTPEQVEALYNSLR